MTKPVNSNLGWETSLPVYVLLLPHMSSSSAIWLVWRQQKHEMSSLSLYFNLQACPWPHPPSSAVRTSYMEAAIISLSLDSIHSCRRARDFYLPLFSPRLLTQQDTLAVAAGFSDLLVLLHSYTLLFFFVPSLCSSGLPNLPIVFWTCTCSNHIWVVVILSKVDKRHHDIDTRLNFRIFL